MDRVIIQTIGIIRTIVMSCISPIQNQSVDLDIRMLNDLDD